MENKEDFTPKGPRPLRLSFEERELLEKLSREPLSQRAIGRKMKRSTWMVTKEYQRTGGRETYTAQKAQATVEEGRLPARYRARDRPLFTPQEEQLIRALAEKSWSLQKIADEVHSSRRCVAKFFQHNGISYRERSAAALEKRVDALEMHLEILLDEIRRLDGKN